jgi:hypothetical protein
MEAGSPKILLVHLREARAPLAGKGWVRNEKLRRFHNQMELKGELQQNRGRHPCAQS